MALNIKSGFVHAKEAAALFGVSKNTWFNWRKRGVISKGVVLGYNRTGWPAEELQLLYERMNSGEVVISQ